MSDLGDPVHWLLPPDPDATEAFRDWPAPARHRLALCALLDRIDDVTSTGTRVGVVVAGTTGSPWIGLAARLRSYGAEAQVAGMVPGQATEQMEMPADADSARAGRHGAAMLGPADTPVRHLGVTVTGTPGETPWTGPWMVLTDEGWRAELSPTALLDPVLGLRPGQRLQVMVTLGAEPRVVSAWH
ncbi:hypothetical protein [Raineyella fluvialis]|uniref:Uncharacterized protein n=1 Tax=Raineyella fluvialis TaxID=2662261 RepID=A0A5Q2FEK4_9ACTN|nr:hypothetical protein [Raineyella fluvialis]QGF24821.1 hypothetical protein Rai3103_15640 [Raineyella fluvialis]